MPRPRRHAYDLVIDNDWVIRPRVVLFRGGSSLAEIIDFVAWCGKVTRRKFRVQFRGSEVIITNAPYRPGR